MFLSRLNITLSLIFFVLMSVFIKNKYFIILWFFLAILLLYLFVFLELIFFHVFLTNKDFEGKKITSKLKYFYAYQIAYLFSIYFFRTKFILINKEKLPKTNKFTIFANHKSNTDPAAIFMLMKGRAVAFTPKSELKKALFFHKWLESVGSFYIYRDSPKNTVKELNYGIENAKKGLPYVIYLEGGIVDCTTDLVKQVKPGALKLAQKAETDILPISYTNARFVRNRFPFLTKIYVEVGDLIKYEDIKHLNTYDLGELVKDKINQKIYTKMEG